MTTKTVNGVRLLIVEDYDAMSHEAAAHILRRVRANRRLAMLVPTGTTPEGVYRLLTTEPADLFANASFYNMDEYCERLDDESYAFLSATDERSYHFYMQEHVFRQFTQSKSFFPGLENIEHPGSYDKLIAANGGLDLCLNAVGEDGHTFGFNIPGSAFDSKTRLMALNEDTKEVNKRLTGLETPQLAVTVGLSTGMRAKEVLLLVSGMRKAEILKRVVYGDISEDVPATIMRRHKNCIWIVDEDAASRL
jgi:glucosamine-6-phosphate deaminase